MSVFLNSEDISRIAIKYEVHNEAASGYAVVYLKDPMMPVKVFHFMFSMDVSDFNVQTTRLETAAMESRFDVDLQKKSRFVLTLERLLVGALAGTEYRDRGCPACRMIDIFVSGGQPAT